MVLYIQLVLEKISPVLNLLHVYGSPYAMGFAHGTLLKEQITAMFPQVELYMEQQVDQVLSDLPLWLQHIIADAGVTAALELTYWLTEPYIPQYWLDELRGLADGSGMEYMQVVRIHMLPELIQASCTMVGAWGPAVANTNGTLYQLRALDWSTDGPFQQYPAYIVYHPDQGHDFAILTWAGFIGTVTGYSSAPIGLCEKVWYAYNGTKSRSGYPWHFLTRDILQFDVDVDSALSRIANTERTCSIWLGLADPVGEFKAIGYSHDYVLVYDDQNYPFYEQHPRMPGIVFIDKHVQPSHNPCLGLLLQKYYGNITPEITKTYITALHETGNMHIAIYDFKANNVYVANASPYVNNTYIPAFNRPFIQLDMTALFAVPPPK